ncbi:MAG TPA: hypothetical protein VEO95_04905, partial [Chthoniobacteraceae bacterium]|nr:hypothetical protein [Chthoniobacteraceae bacterium]
DDGEGRYALLESVWDYAEQKLASAGETTRWRDRHLDFFVRFAEDAEAPLTGPDQVEWLDRVATEHFNLRYALRWSLESLDGIARGLRLAGALTRYWEVRNFLAEGREQFEELLTRADESVPPAVLAKCWFGAGRLAWCHDRDEDALRCYVEAQRLYAQLGDRLQVGLMHAYLGFTERNEGRTEAALAHFEKAQAIGAELESERLLATARSGLSSIAADQGELAAARALKEESMAMLRRFGDKWIVCLVAWSTAKIAVAQGDDDAARAYLREAVELSAALGNKWSAPYALESFGDLAANQRDGARAARLYGAASTLREALGLRLSPAEKIAYDSALARIRALAGDESFEGEWTAGSALRAEEALAFATQPA